MFRTLIRVTEVEEEEVTLLFFFGLVWLFYSTVYSDFNATSKRTICIALPVGLLLHIG